MEAVNSPINREQATQIREHASSSTVHKLLYAVSTRIKNRKTSAIRSTSTQTTCFPTKTHFNQTDSAQTTCELFTFHDSTSFLQFLGSTTTLLTYVLDIGADWTLVFGLYSCMSFDYEFFGVFVSRGKIGRKMCALNPCCNGLPFRLWRS